jgi:chloramphenicol-sensitive protein RarD
VKPSPTPTPEPPGSEATTGVLYGLAAFVTWGLLPLYFHAIRHVPAVQTLAHRICWATIVLVAILTLRHGWRDGAAAIGARDSSGRRSAPRLFVATTILLSTNWLVYILAVNTGRVLEASLGYFVTPLVNVALGAIVLRETLSRLQRIAIAIASVGVLTLMIGTGSAPWIPLVLALSFGTYGLLRKRLAVPPMMALFVETAAVLPLALGFLLWTHARGDGAWLARDATTDALLLGTGIITAFPLVWFAHAARRLRLTTLGTLQYISPSLGMMLALFVFGESFGVWHALAFAAIWSSLALWGVDVARAQRRLRSQAATDLR